MKLYEICFEHKTMTRSVQQLLLFESSTLKTLPVLQHLENHLNQEDRELNGQTIQRHLRKRALWFRPQAKLQYTEREHSSPNPNQLTIPTHLQR